MKKRIFTMICTIILAAALTGCANTVNEKQIQTDLETNTQFDFLKEGESIDELVIDKRQTDKEEKIDTIWCTITTADEEISYEKNVVLIYGLYDKGGWILDDVIINESTKTPLKGIEEADIEASLNGQSVEADGERWNITANNIKNISVDSHETNLEEKTDTITLTLTLDEDVEEAAGQIVIHYIFDEEWEIDSVSENTEFTTKIKPDKVLNVTEEHLIEELDKQKFQYGESKTDSGNGLSLVDYRYQQTITIDKSEISDFIIEDQVSSSKGCDQEYTCSYTLTKQNVTFHIQAQIKYHFDGSNGWTVESITMLPEAVSVNIEGDWKGDFVAAGERGEATLSITDIDDNGTISGVYSWTSSYSKGSYSVSGTVDNDILHFHLTAGEWIEEPERASFITKLDIGATLYVDAAEMEGTGHESSWFTIRQ